MKENVEKIFNKLFSDHPSLTGIRDDILKAFNIMKECYENGGKIMICGNGGSASDSEHITGELMKGFILKRNIPYSDREKIADRFPEDVEFISANLQGALPAISLVSQTSLISAFSNDVSGKMIFAQQVYGYKDEGDVLLGISSSGNSEKVVYEIKVAAAFGLKTIGLTGRDGGQMGRLCDAAIVVPEQETYRIQEYHLPIYHALCAMIELHFFE